MFTIVYFQMGWLLIMNVINEYFGKVVCLNLERRPDRKESVQKEFDKIGLDVEIVKGIDGWRDFRGRPHTLHNGNVGISMTNIREVEKAKEEGCESLVILEDDIVFTEDSMEVIEDVLRNQLPDDWDVLYLGCHNGVYDGTRKERTLENTKHIGGRLYEVEYVVYCHAFVIRDTVYDEWIEKLSKFDKVNDDCLASIYNKNENRKGYAIMNPGVVFQKEDFSDNNLSKVEERFVD